MRWFPLVFDSSIARRLTRGRPRTDLNQFAEGRLRLILRVARRFCASVAVAMQLTHLANAFLLQQPLPDLDANEEGTVMTWASTVATAAVAIAAALAAWATGPRKTHLALALAASFLSLDDTISLHERLSVKLLHLAGLDPAWDSVVWPVLYLPIVVVTAVLILLGAGTGTRETTQHAVAGLGLLAVALICEVLSAPWSTGTNVVHTVLGGVEETLELAGWILIASGLFGALFANIVRQSADPRGPA